MQSENPYGKLNNDSSNYTKVAPTVNQEHKNYSHSELQQQQQLQGPLTHLDPPQMEMISNSEESNLLQHQNAQQKKIFVIKVALIGLIQEIYMILASFFGSYNSTLIKIFFDKNVVQWPCYLVIIVSITSTISSRFLKPAKDQFLQVVIQVYMSILYIFQASAISILFGSAYGWYVAMLCCHALTLFSLIITNAIKYRDDQPFQKYITVQFLVISLPYIGILIFFLSEAGKYALVAFLLSFMAWFLVLGWTLAFGLLLLYSIEQLLNGKCQLHKSDFAAAATTVYGNMVTPLC